MSYSVDPGRAKSTNSTSSKAGSARSLGPAPAAARWRVCPPWMHAIREYLDHCSRGPNQLSRASEEQVGAVLDAAPVLEGQLCRPSDAPTESASSM